MFLLNLLSCGSFNLINRVKYVEQELAKKKGKNIDMTDQVENELKHAEDELYTILEHLKVSGLVDVHSLIISSFIMHTSIQLIMPMLCFVK